MKRVSQIVAMMLLTGATSANAANITALVHPANLLNLVLLVGASLCAALCLQVLELVRGGQLSRSWQLFLGGFVVMGLSQLLAILQAMEILILPTWVVPMMMVAMGALFYFGLVQLKRVLG